MMLLKKELKLEVGKKYLNGRGEVFGPMEMNNGSLHEKFPFKAKGAHLEAFRENGTYSLNPFKESHLDLISEYTDGAANGYTEEKNTVEVSKEFVLKAYIEACVEWRDRIEKELPELFPVHRFEDGQWIKHRDFKGHDFMAIYNEHDIKSGKGMIGFGYSGRWTEGIDKINDIEYILRCYRPASDKEVEEAFIAEANRRGYEEGNYRCLVGKTVTHSDNYRYHPVNNKVTSGYINSCANVVFDSGRWAEIIAQTEITLEQIAEKFNIPVSQLRIKE